MGDDPDPQEAREAPLDTDQAWACLTSVDDPRGPFLFLTDHDASDGIRTKCFKQTDVVDGVRAAYYTVKTLKELRRRLPP